MAERRVVYWMVEESGLDSNWVRFSPLHSFQIRPGDNSAYYTMGDSYPEVKQLRREFTTELNLVTRFRIYGAIPTLPPISFQGVVLNQ
jgi:hypothetical protein